MLQVGGSQGVGVGCVFVAGKLARVCVRISVGNRDTMYTDLRFNPPSTYTATEDKSGMFLGGAMASMGDQFIVSQYLVSPKSLVTPVTGGETVTCHLSHLSPLSHGLLVQIS